MRRPTPISAHRCGYIGQGGTIPLMNVLEKGFPKAQMMVCGVLGPKSNAHGPNEFLHLPYGKKLTAAVAQVIAAMPLTGRAGQASFSEGLAGRGAGLRTASSSTHRQTPNRTKGPAIAGPFCFVGGSAALHSVGANLNSISPVCDARMGMKRQALTASCT